MKYTRTNKKEICFLMLTGCLLGILCFALVYGFKIVDVTYNGWLFHGDMDLRQHYVGFCHYRTSPWHFPIGIIDTLSVPYSMSVVYTDSIPLFAVIFKLFAGVLPESFQYFGLFGLISFALMGALSPVLIRRFSTSKNICLFGSLFFILSFPVLHRMFYHTALAAQWIIVLALIVLFYTDITDKASIKRICIYWALIGLLSVSVHSYFVFMTGIVLLAQIVDGFVKVYKNGRATKENLIMLSPLASMGVSSFVLLYILGGFYGSGSVSGDGFGSFYANLSSYVNPLHFSSIFKGFENNGMFEFEGFSYLGAGMLLILIAAAVSIIVSKLRSKRNKSEQREENEKVIENNKSEQREENEIISKDNKSGQCEGNEAVDKTSKPQQLEESEIISRNTYIVMWIFVVMVLVFSCFPNYSFGSYKIINLPVPGFIKRIFGICRTNARFVWIGMYLMYVMAISFIGKHFDKIWIKLLFAIAVILQLYDMSGTIKRYKAEYEKPMEFETVWTGLEPEHVIDGKKEFVFMYDYNDIMMDTAYYAYMHGMSQNSFYYARTIYDEIDSTIAEWSDEFLSGELNRDAVYVFRTEDYTDEYDSIVNKLNANKYVIDGHVVITAE